MADHIIVACVQSDMQELIETRMADEIARDNQVSTVSPARQHDISATKLMFSPTKWKRFSLRWS